MIGDFDDNGMEKEFRAYLRWSMVIGTLWTFGWIGLLVFLCIHFF